MYTIDLAQYVLKNRTGKMSPGVLIEKATGKQMTDAAKPDKDQISYNHLNLILNDFIHPELCKALPFIKWNGEYAGDVSWDLKDPDVSKISATIILSQWMKERKWRDKVSQFYGKRFHYIFERFFRLKTMKENKGEGITWHEAGGVSDGGIDSYGQLGERVYVVQSKAANVSAKYIRELFGTWFLISSSREFRRKFAKEFMHIHWPVDECNLILCTNKDVPFDQRKKQLDIYKTPNLNFSIMGPWALAWYIIENCEPETLEKGKQFKKEDLDDLLISLWALSTEEENQ